MHPSLHHLEHRPWPLPDRRWAWRQRWHDLLFAHWRVDARELRPLVPESLQVQEFDGSSWIGVVPFRMSGVTRRPFPSVPGLSAFPELNLRVYVERDGKPGVWFLSLEATNRLAVWAARRFFHLPYFHADITIEERDGEFAYTSSRRGASPLVEFRARYRPTSDVFASTPGTLEHFLTERYCLYARDAGGGLSCTEVHHAPWPLQSATAEIDACTLERPHGLELTGEPETLHFARRLEVVVWSPEALSRARPSR